MKPWNDLTLEQQAATRDPGTGEDGGGWSGYPRVDAREAEALRNGQAYRPTDFDWQRLSTARVWGLQGDPETDPLIVKCLAKGYIAENPRWRAEEFRIAARIAELAAQYGPGTYSVGVGNGLNRWILTATGRAFLNSVLESTTPR